MILNFNEIAERTMPGMNNGTDEWSANTVNSRLSYLQLQSFIFPTVIYFKA